MGFDQLLANNTQGPPPSMLCITGCGQVRAQHESAGMSGMTTSCAAPAKFTIFDVLIAFGLSGVEAEKELCSGLVTVSGQVVTDPYRLVGYRDRVWLRNKLVRAGSALVHRTPRFPGHRQAVPAQRWARRPRHRGLRTPTCRR
jgi:hypothetical protein